MTISNKLLICGDLNICLNLIYDEKGGNREIESHCVKDLKSFMEEIDIVDTWRIRYPDRFKYS